MSAESSLRLTGRDPLATYDALGRKAPKTLGLIELMRGLPWLLGAFDKEVPQEFVVVEVGVATVSCPCQPEVLPRVPFNIPVYCQGEGCRRWFFFDGIRVRVAREPGQPDP